MIWDPFSLLFALASFALTFLAARWLRNRYRRSRPSAPPGATGPESRQVRRARERNAK